MALTLKEVRKRVAEIRAAADDEETAHGLEDKLYEAVLREVAREIVDIDSPTLKDRARMARAALRTKRLNFQRHCA